MKRGTFVGLGMGVILAMFGLQARAVDLSKDFSFDGFLLNDVTGVPLVGAQNLKFQIWDPSGNCLLFEETQTITPDVDGAFSAKVGAGTRASPGVDGGLVWRHIFQNDALVRNVGTNCSVAYTPANNDSRRLRVTVNSVVMTPDFQMGAVPMASVAESLQGRLPTDFVEKTGSTQIMTAPLKIQNQQLQLGNGAYYIGISAPSLGSSYSLVLPVDDGTTGQVLTTDGSGILSWTTPAGGSGITSLNGLTSGVQTFGVPATTGTAPAWSSVGSTHTLNIPMASTPGVVAGLMSNTEFNVIATKMNKAGDAMTGNLDMSGNYIHNLATPSGGADAANKSYVDSAVSGSQPNLGYTPVNRAGDTMTGNLNMGSTYMVTNMPDPSGLSDAANKNYVDNQNALKLNKGGDSMTGALNMTGNGVTNIAAPAAGGDAANKSYVDSALLGLQGTLSSNISSVSSSVAAKVSKAGDTMTGDLSMDGVAVRYGLSGNYIDMRAPAGLSGSYTLQLPLNTGTSNQVLTTDGAGILSWTTPAGGGIGTLNGLAAGSQTFANGTGGNSPAFSSVGSIHTLNIPMASNISVSAGLISKTDYDNFSAKQPALGFTPFNKAGDWMSGSITMNSWPIVSLADPSNPQDAATKNYVDSSLNGLSGTITGNLSSGLGGKLNLTGGTMTGVISMSGNRIANMSDPSTTTDAATKNYVDVHDVALGTTITSNAAALGSVSIGMNNKLNKVGDQMMGALTLIAGTISNPGLSFGNSTGVYAPAAGQMVFGTSGSEVMRMTGTGSVGIGTAAPTAKLSVLDNTSNNLRLETISGAQTAAAIFSSPSRNFMVGMAGSGAGGGMGDKFVFFDQTSGGVRMAIDNTGRVAIGSPNAVAHLDVNVTVSGGAAEVRAMNSSNNSTARYVVGASTIVGAGALTFEAHSASSTWAAGQNAAGDARAQGGSTIFWSGTGGAPLSMASATYLRFYTGSGVSNPTSAYEAMRIDNSGNVGIGTTSPSAKLDVAGPSKFGAVIHNIATATQDTVSTPCSPALGCLVLGGGGASAYTFNYSTASSMSLACLDNGMQPGETIILMINNTSTYGINFTNGGGCPGGKSPLVFNGSLTAIPASSGKGTLQLIYDGTNWRVVSAN